MSRDWDHKARDDRKKTRSARPGYRNSRPYGSEIEAVKEINYKTLNSIASDGIYSATALEDVVRSLATEEESPERVDFCTIHLGPEENEDEFIFGVRVREKGDQSRAYDEFYLTGHYTDKDLERTEINGQEELLDNSSIVLTEEMLDEVEGVKERKVEKVKEEFL